MCRLRQIQDVYECNHVFRHPDKTIHCEGPRCKISPNHPDECPNCSTTCWQYRLFPEQIERQYHDLCPICQNLPGPEEGVVVFEAKKSDGPEPANRVDPRYSMEMEVGKSEGIEPIIIESGSSTERAARKFSGHSGVRKV